MGSYLARLAKKSFGILIPVVPIKGYSFDVTTDLPMQSIHLAFKDKAFVATNYQPGKWRIAAFGDVAG